MVLDLRDSLASACYSLKLSVDEGEEYGYNSGISKQIEAYKTIENSNVREQSRKIFQNMVEGLY